MKEFGAGRIAFYLGVLSMVLAALSIPIELNVLGATPAKFLQSADTLLLIAIVVVLNDMKEKMK